MDNYVTRNNFLGLAEDVRLLVFLEFSRRIRRMLSMGKHFGFNMLSSFVAHALLILIFSRFCRCYTILLWLRCPVEMELPTRFATVWESIDQSLHKIIDSSLLWIILFRSYLLRFPFEMVLHFVFLVSVIIVQQNLSLLLLSPFDFKLAYPLWYLSWFRICYNIHEFTELYFTCCLSLMEHSLRLQAEVTLSADRTYVQVLVS